MRIYHREPMEFLHKWGIIDFILRYVVELVIVNLLTTLGNFDTTAYYCVYVSCNCGPVFVADSMRLLLLNVHHVPIRIVERQNENLREGWGNSRKMKHL